MKLIKDIVPHRNEDLELVREKVDITKYPHRKVVINMLNHSLQLATQEYEMVTDFLAEAKEREAKEGKFPRDYDNETEDEESNDDEDVEDEFLDSEMFEMALEDLERLIINLKDAEISAYQQDFYFLY